MIQLGPPRIPQGQQFPQGARLNGSHPLMQGLGFFAVAQGAVANDLIGGTVPTLTGTLAQKTLRTGQALTFTGAAANRLTWPAQTANLWANATDFTVSVLGSIKGTDYAAGSNTYPILLKFASSSSHVGVGIENVSGNLFCNFVADNLTAVVGSVNIGTSASANCVGFSSTNQTALYTWRVRGSTLDFFINGVLIDTVAITTRGIAVAAAIASASSGAGWSAAGAVQAWWVHNRGLEQSEIVQLSTFPWCMFANVAAPDPYLFDGGTGGGVTYTLTAAQGSFALSGQAAALKFNRALSAAQGSFTLSGQTVNFVHGYTLTAARGTFALSGQAANLLFNRKLLAAQGAFALTGQSANLLFNRKILAAQGSFALTGQAANLLYGRKILANVGTFALTGFAANLVYTPIGGATYTLPASTGSFALTGQSANLLMNRRLTAAVGSYSLNGQAANLVYTRPGDLSVLFGGGFFPKRKKPDEPIEPIEALAIVEADGTQAQRDRAARIEADRLFERLAERDLSKALAKKARAEAAWAREVAQTILRERDDEEVALFALLLDD